MPAPSWKEQGNALLAQGRIAEAAQCYQQAVRAAPRDPLGHVNLGYALLELGRLKDALDSFTAAVALDSGCVDAYYLMAQAHAGTGRRDRAADCLRKALALKPDFDFAWRDLATLLEQDQNLDAALRAWESAIGANAAFADARIGRARVLLRLDRPDEACEEAVGLARSATSMPLLLAASEILHKAGRTADALPILEAAAGRFPEDPAALRMRAQLLLESDRPDQALPIVRRLAEMDPASPETLNGLGVVLYCLGRWDEAVEVLTRAVAVDPPDSGHLHNLGCAHLSRNDPDAVIAVADRGLRFHPEDADLRWLRAVSSHLNGDMQRGWEDYEWRWYRHRGVIPVKPEARLPEWRGEALPAGTTLLVHAEQGFGDSIQFLRFLPLLVERGLRVFVCLQPALVALARGLIRGHGVTVVAQGGVLPQADRQCAMMSLPFLLKVTLPTLDGRPYLAVDPALRARWLARLGPAHQPRVGIVWSGNPKPDPNRSVVLADLLAVLPRGVQLVSLQKELRESDSPALRSRPDLLYFGSELESFSDTAALADCLDLVITIDTSVAHLVGAIGKPMWVLLPYVPDWRWLLNRQDSPWYKCATLLRQDESRTWQSVLASLPARLAEAGIKAPA